MGLNETDIHKLVFMAYQGVLLNKSIAGSLFTTFKMSARCFERFWLSSVQNIWIFVNHTRVECAKLRYVITEHSHRFFYSVK